jgi:glycosyltransferase involved in cell wall biosynthesis/GT2 family glycosyltransferase
LLEADVEVRLCVLGPATSGLRPLRDWAPVHDLILRTGQSFSAEEQQRLRDSIIRRDVPVSRGDHVIFTGVVWTEQYIVLFRNLAAFGVTFSVLVHDIIPLLAQPSEDEGHARVFARWIRTTLEHATMIYVSNWSVAQDLARWAVAARIRPKAKIAEIGFGGRDMTPSSGGDATALAQVDKSNFVLCVGTIDARKNQRFLVKVWQELAARVGHEACPQLVLVGRDDLGLHEDAAFQALAAFGKIKLLQGLCDREVANLFIQCRFTAFPSQSEGYGLPVAESLRAGKLCIASDLPSIRAHGGDLVWYFNPEAFADAVAAFEHAVVNPTAVRSACERIQQEHRQRSWSDTFKDISERIAAVVVDPPASPHNRAANDFAGSTRVPERILLARAAAWCVDTDIDVSIVIVNWNAAAMTMDCVRQVWAVTEGIRYEIIIADNGSAEAEVAPLRNLGTGVHLIEIGCNRFFGEANNIAVEMAKGNFVCFLNNDAFVEDGWLTALRQVFHSNPRAGAVGPLYRFPDGRIQEGGGIIDAGGYPIRGGRGSISLNVDLMQEREVDYISAAALLVDKSLFMEVGGFDLQYEPSYYEDTDLCFKIAAVGRTVVYTPQAEVVHIEGASANGDAAAEVRRKHLGDLNRGKFVARWGRYLERRDPEDLAIVRKRLGLEGNGIKRAILARTAPTAVVYTAEPLTPGGGERYLLTLAELLQKTHHVTLVTPHPYSYSRIHDIGAVFGFDLSGLGMALPDTVAWEAADIQVVMGNHVVPLVPGRARVNLFHCQFPFPLPKPPSRAERETLAGYDRIIVNSRFTALHVEASLNGFQLPDMPISVLPPPTQQLSPGPKSEDIMRIISVGRFFRGGHSKRHDLMIEAFKLLVSTSSRSVELHLAGSSHPEPDNVTYLADLMSSAAGAPIYFHVNAAADDLEALYATANIYWHAAGLGSNLVAEPWAAEHFGISIVEAMSAGALPLALASGGAREIITHGVDGFLYDTAEALVEQTAALIAAPAARRAEMATAAIVRARDYSVEAFAEKLSCLLREFGPSP